MLFASFALAYTTVRFPKKKWHDECDLDSFPAYCVGLREMYIIVNMIYDRRDPVIKANTYRCMRGMIQDAAAAGFGEYRTHLLLSDQVAGTYSWNNKSSMRFHEPIKDIMDPTGILAPGGNGIWPRKYRNKGWELDENDLGPCNQVPIPAVVGQQCPCL